MRRHLSVCAAVLLLSTAAAAAQLCGSFDPMGPSFRVNGNNSYWQRDGVVDFKHDGTMIATAWTTGEDIWMRLFDGAGAPLTGDIFVIDTLSAGNQDQPSISIDANNRILVAWSDRNGYDGEAMGIYARIFDAAGVAQGTEFQVNVEWQASQFRPLIAPARGGGWVVAWTGRWDGDAFFAILDTNGTSTTGDVQINTFTNAAQVRPAPAVAADGTIFVAYSDSSGNGGVGSGLNVWGRVFNVFGVPQGAEFHLAGNLSAGDQREVRVAADFQGRFIATWEDEQNDSSSWGVYARRFDITGAPLGDPFRVNTTTAGSQRSPSLAADAAGNFVIIWEDSSSGDTEVVARRYGPQGQLLSGEMTINDSPTGNQTLPRVDTTFDGNDWVFIWEGPEVERDVFARRYVFTPTPDPVNYCSALPNSSGGPASIGWHGSPSVAVNGFVLTCTSAPASHNGLFIYSPDPVESPLGNGNVCVGPQTLGFVLRLPFVTTDLAGYAEHALDMTAPPHALGLILPGSTWFFQCWFRDLPAGGAFFNFSDGLQATFCP